MSKRHLRVCRRCGQEKHLKYFPLVDEDNALDMRRHQSCQTCIGGALSKLKTKKRIAQNKKVLPAKRRHAANKRRAAELQAIPPWYNDFEVLSFYKTAVYLTERTGVKHQVDHIIPLQGRHVCGLHVQTNLQVITATENLRKSNRLTADGRS